MLAITPKKDEYKGREGKSRWLREKACPVHEDDVARWLSRVQNAARDEEISVICAIEVGNMILFIFVDSPSAYTEVMHDRFHQIKGRSWFICEREAIGDDLLAVSGF